MSDTGDGRKEGGCGCDFGVASWAELRGGLSPLLTVAKRYVPNIDAKALEIGAKVLGVV